MHQEESLIRVSRFEVLEPHWGRLVHPNLQNIGPDTYDLGELDLWCCDDQRMPVSGQVVYDRIKVIPTLLDSCLSLADLKAIKEQVSVSTFKKIFPHVDVLAFWKSVSAEREGGFLRVPCLGIHGDDFVEYWRYLTDQHFTDTNFTPRFIM